MDMVYLKVSLVPVASQVTGIINMVNLKVSLVPVASQVGHVGDDVCYYLLISDQDYTDCENFDYTMIYLHEWKIVFVHVDHVDYVYYQAGDVTGIINMVNLKVSLVPVASQVTGIINMVSLKVSLVPVATGHILTSSDIFITMIVV
jgi:hypothetical protein